MNTKSNGGRSEHDPVAPVLDDRLPDMLFDALATVQAVVASKKTGAPCSEARQAMNLSEEQKCEFTRALQAVAVRYQAFFTEHKTLIELTTVLAAINAAHVDAVFATADAAQSGTGPTERRACSNAEALVAALYILAPLVLFAVLVILGYVRRN